MSKEETKVLSEMNPLLETYNTTKPENEKFMLFELKRENEKLKQEKQELIEWVKEKIKNCNPNPQLYFNAQDEIKRHLYGEILEKLGE